MRSTFLLITAMVGALLAAACAPAPRAPMTPDDGQLGPGVTAQPTNQAATTAPTDGQPAPADSSGPTGGDSSGSGDETEGPGNGGTVDGGDVEAPPMTPHPN